MRKFKFLFACGTGIATSTAAAIRCKDALKEHGIEIEHAETQIGGVIGKAQTFKPDVIISTAQLSDDICPEIKKFKGLCFITGMKMDSTVQEIIEYLKSIE